MHVSFGKTRMNNDEHKEGSRYEILFELFFNLFCFATYVDTSAVRETGYFVLPE